VQDIQSLIEYISASRPIFVVGAGPSCDAGLPSWKRLTSGVLDELRLLPKLDIEAAEEAFAKDKYAICLGLAAKLTSLDWLYNTCGKLLDESGKRGAQYALLTKLPAHGFITTNFDALLEAHFDDASQASISFGNDHDQLAQVDFATQRSIVKLHSDFKNTNTIVLTDRQYRDVLHDPKFLPLRTFLAAQFQANRIVFIGYSFNDPDLDFLLEATTRALRRKVPLFGIIANARPDSLDDWFERYNLRVLSYKAPSEDHSNLKNILDSLVTYFATEARAEKTVPFVAAQSLYMWHKLQSSEGSEATIDALKAILLGTIADQKSPMNLSAIRVRISQTVRRLSSPALESAVTSSLVKLQKEKLILLDATTSEYSASALGAELQKTYASQFNNLRRLFEAQVRFDLRAKLPTLKDDVFAALVDAVHRCLLQVFNERGAELADSVLSNKFETNSNLDLAQTINDFTKTLDDSTRFAVFSYLMSLITKPSIEQRGYLDYLAKAFFATQAIGIDPEGELFRREVLKARTLIIDANILIPLLAEESANQGYFAYCIKTFKRAGITLCTIPSFLDEVAQHFNWAAKHVREFGPQSIQVLECALGGGEFRRNECIDGFVRCSARDGSSIDEYLYLCFSGEANFANIKEKCSESGIELLSINHIADAHHDVWTVREEVEEYITGQQIYNETPKSEQRIKGEAYAYAVCYGWKYVKPEGIASELWRCSVVSQGGSLNRVARFGPHPFDRPIVLRPDSLEEFVSSFVGSEQKVSVSEAMLANYVHSIDHFIDREKYADFFRPLIRDSEKIYKENIDLFQNLVEGEIFEDELSEYEELDRPFVVNALQKKVLASTRAENDALSADLERLKKENERNAELASRALSQLSLGARKRIERIIDGDK
jgi:hypothetical protein